MCPDPPAQYSVVKSPVSSVFWDALETEWVEEKPLRGTEKLQELEEEIS
jgi:hypothetical protein